MEEVQGLVAVTPRDAGTEGAARAARYIRERLESKGIQARVDEFIDRTPKGPVTFRNVLGSIPGRGRGVIILGAHYDTKSGIGGFEGANDSGSGVGLLIELAGVLNARPHGPADILLAFLDGEECLHRYGQGDGLHGSRRLAESLIAEAVAPAVRGVVILDMIGDRDLTPTIPSNATPRMRDELLRAAADGSGVTLTISPPMMDDHVPFLERGIPAVDLIDFTYGSLPGANDYWHTPADRMDKLSPGSLEVVGRWAIRLVDRLQGE